jgi:hypothetical protein
MCRHSSVGRIPSGSAGIFCQMRASRCAWGGDGIADPGVVAAEFCGGVASSAVSRRFGGLTEIKAGWNAAALGRLTVESGSGPKSQGGRAMGVATGMAGLYHDGWSCEFVETTCGACGMQLAMGMQSDELCLCGTAPRWVRINPMGGCLFAPSAHYVLTAVGLGSIASFVRALSGFPEVSVRDLQ